MGNIFENLETSQSPENSPPNVVIVLDSMVSLVKLEYGSGERMVPFHLFHGRNFISPPCCHFAMSVVSVRNTKLGDIFPPSTTLPAGGLYHFI